MSQEYGQEAEFPVDAGSSSTATQAAPARTKPARRPKQLPMFKVLLHNDDVNTFDHALASVMKLVALPLEEAVERVLEAHETGVALLLVTHLERAELLVEQFCSLSLTVTIEPA